MAKANINKICTEVKYSPEHVSVNKIYKRRYTNSHSKAFADAIKKANHAFDLQMVKNCDVRFQCIEHFAKQKFESMALFWALYMQRADSMLNSRRFVLEAKKLGVDPVVLATNVVAHGATEVKKVATYGIIGSQIKVEEYLCPIVPDEVVRKYMENPEEFFSKEVAPKEAIAEMAEAPVAEEAPAA